MSAEIELTGIDEIIKRIEDLGKQGKKVEESAIEKGAEVILKQAKDNLSGQIKKSITGKLEEGLKISNSKSMNGRKYVLVGIQKDDDSEIFYGKFIEWGASAHKIRIRRGKLKGRVIPHTGIAPKPFLGPAYESKKEEAQEVIKNELKKGLGL